MLEIKFKFSQYNESACLFIINSKHNTCTIKISVKTPPS